MTTQESLTNVRNNLSDAGVNFFSDSVILTSIQDAYDDVSVYCGQIERSRRLSFLNEKTYYDMPTLISDFYAVTAIYNYNTKLWLIDASSQEMDQIRWDWENWEGQPRWFWPHDFRRVALVPRLTIAAGSMEVFYRAKAPTLSLSSVPLIKSESVKLLEFYATGDLLRSAKEVTKAKVWMTQYLEKREEYRSDVKTLSEADRIRMIQQHQYPVLL